MGKAFVLQCTCNVWCWYFFFLNYKLSEIWAQFCFQYMTTAGLILWDVINIKKEAANMLPKISPPIKGCIIILWLTMFFSFWKVKEWNPDYSHVPGSFTVMMPSIVKLKQSILSFVTISFNSSSFSFLNTLKPMSCLSVLYSHLTKLK